MNNLGRGSENNKSDKERILTRETVGMVVVLFAALALLILVTRSIIFGNVGFAISSFMLGTFGYCSFAVLAALFYLGFTLITGKKITVAKKTVVLSALLFVFLVCLVHTITAAVGGIEYGSYGAYLSACYRAGENSFFQTTGGGVIFGLFVYPVAKLTTAVGGYIIFSLLMAATVYFIYASKRDTVSSVRAGKRQKTVATISAEEMATRNTNGIYDLNYAAPELAQPAVSLPFGNSAVQTEHPVAERGDVQPVAESSVDKSKRLFAVGEGFDFKSSREIKRENKKAEAQRREQQRESVQDVSPYARSHAILYPPKSNQQSSYTNNLIFDTDSYFNNRNREVSREQYSNNFKGTGSAGHELTSRTENPNVSASVSSYSNLYTDGEDGNITYSNKPKKIVTDTTRPVDSAKPDTPYATFKMPANNSTENTTRDFYRNDVTASSSVPPTEAPKVMQTTPTSQNNRTDLFSSISARRTPRQEQQSELPKDNFETADRRGLDVVPESPVQSPRIENTGRMAEMQQNRMRERSVSRIDSVSETVEAEDNNVLYQNRNEESVGGLKSVDEHSFESAADLFDTDELELDSVGEAGEPGSSVIPAAMESTTRLRSETVEEVPSLGRRDRGVEVRTQATEKQEEVVKPKHVYQKYVAPPISLLRDYAPSDDNSAEEVALNSEVIVETLGNFKIPCEVVKVTQGPMVTRYDINIPGNIPAARVLNCDRELAMRLHSKDGVNIQPNYENGSISIEVPRRNRTLVGLKEVIAADNFVNARDSAIMFGMGKDIEGREISGDIAKMKHLLVAGSTGSGKSVCLNSLIISLLYKYSPEQLRIILVDPKQVEFNIYDKLPHLMINEIIYEPAKVITTLNWAIAEMERRYSLFKAKSKKGVLVRDLDEYNANLFPEEERLPKIVLIVDELADLMLVAKKDLEARIQSLTQKSRAAGIHLVLATQRPSVDVITGIIKSNLPTRVAFKVVQEVDSRTILDSTGAEKLLGYGDMLYKTDTMTMPSRVQGAFLSSQEVQDVVNFVKEHNEAYFDDSVSDYINNSSHSDSGIGGGDADDSVEGVYIEALRYVVSIGQASISMIQRKCSVGYPKAGKIVEWMENMGYISAFDGAKSRKVLLTQEEFDAKYGDFGN